MVIIHWAGAIYPSLEENVGWPGAMRWSGGEQGLAGLRLDGRNGSGHGVSALLVGGKISKSMVSG